MIVYMSKDEWEELKYKVLRKKPLPIPFYGNEEFGEDEEDEYVQLEITRV